MSIHPTIEVATLGMWDTMIVMILALVVFGPRRLPKIGRQIGKLMYEFRKASNDFRYQMEEELRVAEEADRRQREEAERQRALAAAPAGEIAAQTPAAELPAPGADERPEEYSRSEYDGRSSYDEAVLGKYEPDMESSERQPEESRPEDPRQETDELRVQPPATGAPVPAASPTSRASAPSPAAEPATMEPATPEFLPSGDEAAVSYPQAVSDNLATPQDSPEREARAETEPAAHHG